MADRLFGPALNATRKLPSAQQANCVPQGLDAHPPAHLNELPLATVRNKHEFKQALCTCTDSRDCNTTQRQQNGRHLRDQAAAQARDKARGGPTRKESTGERLTPKASGWPWGDRLTTKRKERGFAHTLIPALVLTLALVGRLGPPARRRGSGEPTQVLAAALGQMDRPLVI